MSGAFEPVEDVGAAGVVNLVERVSVRLLNGDGIAAETQTIISERNPHLPDTAVGLLITNHKQ